MMKRCFDVLFSAIGLLIVLPLFLVVAILVKLDSPGPVFFAQKRIGRNLRPFNLYKFSKPARTPCALGTGMNCFVLVKENVIARLDRAIQRWILDSPVKPENDGIEGFKTL